MNLLFTIGYNMPARVSVNSKTEVKGVYVISYLSEIFDNSGNGTYLLNNPAYNYEWVDIQSLDTDTDVNLYYSEYENRSVVRVNLTVNDTEFVVIGSTYSIKNYSIYINPVDNSMGFLSYSGYEILTCSLKNMNPEPTVSTDKSKLCSKMILILFFYFLFCKKKIFSIKNSNGRPLILKIQRK